MKKRKEPLTADVVRHRIKEGQKEADNKVIKRVEFLILDAIENAAEGRQVDDYVTVYCNKVTDDMARYFVERGFEVTVFHKRDGMRISWKENADSDVERVD